MQVLKGVENINIMIKKNSKEMIYEQIIAQIKFLIAQGSLKKGDSLPSIRKLSQSLQVSIISVQRSYDELQKEGVIESVHGKGCFVSAEIDKSFIRDSLFREVEESAKKLMEISKKSDISLEELQKLLEFLWEEEL